MVVFDIFPKAEKEYIDELAHCAEGCGFYCLKFPYGRTPRDNVCFEICLKGDWDLWMHYYDMSKPLLRRYIGTYAWEKER